MVIFLSLFVFSSHRQITDDKLMSAAEIRSVRICLRQTAYLDEKIVQRLQIIKSVFLCSRYPSNSFLVFRWNHSCNCIDDVNVVMRIIHVELSVDGRAFIRMLKPVEIKRWWLASTSHLQTGQLYKHLTRTCTKPVCDLFLPTTLFALIVSRWRCELLRPVWATERCLVGFD